ncbi:MAG: hypothetical protein ABJF04_16030 [Reichenbachiella sp.]|uniref:hypothetical protein n=1 Tax=Reichenbachiella sp. TaxID=2184521 RepID=UPI0032633506
MKKTILFSLTLLLLNSCLPEGYMRTWSTDLDYDKDFKKIMIMGLVNNVTLRSDIEYEVVTAAQKTNLTATNSLSMFPPELGKPFEDVERFKTRLREKGFDGIITVALIDIKAERYIPPETNYEPLVYYDRFRTYYFRTYDLVYRPGYFSQYSKYFIETNFYELKGGTLVWSGRSQIFNPDELESYSRTYSRGLFKELLQEGVISK